MVSQCACPFSSFLCCCHHMLIPLLPPAAVTIYSLLCLLLLLSVTMHPSLYLYAFTMCPSLLCLSCCHHVSVPLFPSSILTHHAPIPPIPSAAATLCPSFDPFFYFFTMQSSLYCLMLPCHHVLILLPVSAALCHNASIPLLPSAASSTHPSTLFSYSVILCLASTSLH